MLRHLPATALRYFQRCVYAAGILFFMQATAQQPDSIRLHKHEKVIFRDTSIIVRRDVTIPYDTSIIKIRKRWPVKFYYDYMFVDPQEVTTASKATSAPCTGKIVGNILLTKKEPFGTSVTDTSRNLKDWLIITGNTVHMITKDRVIFNNLLFEKGDPLKRNSIAESERLLRRLPFILDARVYCVERKATPDTVDVYVITQDVFSISIDINPTGISSVNIALEEANMFGLGQRLYNNFILNATRGVGYEGRYTVFNLYGTYLRGDLSAAFTEDSLLAGISNSRDFVSQEIKNAGGLSYHYRIRRYYSRFDASRARTDVADNNIDAWYGRNFNLRMRSYAFPGQLSFVTAARVSSTWYSERPFTSADTNLVFQHQSLILTSVGVSRSAFAKDVLIANFGLVEDVPIGLLADITIGYSVGEFASRPYTGARITHGTFTRAGYFFNFAEFGSFFQEKKPEDGVLRASSLYISRLWARKKLFKGRVLLRAQYLRGINRTGDNDQIDLNDIEALRGLGTDQLFANTALSGGATLSIFSPWYLLGFRLAFFALADVAYFRPEGEFIFSARPYWGFSTGFRLNNENFILGTIDFNFSFYPSPPPGASVFGFGLALNPIFPFPDFNGKKPGTVIYGRKNKLYY